MRKIRKEIWKRSYNEKIRKKKLRTEIPEENMEKQRNIK